MEMSRKIGIDQKHLGFDKLCTLTPAFYIVVVEDKVFIKQIDTNLDLFPIDVVLTIGDKTSVHTDNDMTIRVRVWKTLLIIPTLPPTT